MGFLQLFKRSEPKDKTKEEILKNKDLMLDVMSESIKGARICPLIQKKCLGKFCEFFMEFKDENGVCFSRCAYVAAPLITLEVKQEIQRLEHIVLTIGEAASGVNQK